MFTRRKLLQSTAGFALLPLSRFIPAKQPALPVGTSVPLVWDDTRKICGHKVQWFTSIYETIDTKGNHSFEYRGKAFILSPEELKNLIETQTALRAEGKLVSHWGMVDGVLQY